METQVETVIPGPVYLQHGKPGSTYKPWLFNKEIHFPWESKASFPLILLPVVHVVIEQPHLLPQWNPDPRPPPFLIGPNFGLYQYQSTDDRADYGIVYCNPNDSRNYIYWLHTFTHSFAPDEWSWFRIVRHLREILGSPIPLL